MSIISQAELDVLYYPIQVKGKVNRFNILGDPEVETFYHKALEDGRYLETSMGEAQHWLVQKQLMIQHRIQTWIKMHLITTDGELPDQARKPKYIADAISIMQTIQTFQKDIQAVITVAAKNIIILLQMEQNLYRMVDADINSLTHLLNSICNWGLPKLPSIPNLLADGMMFWNGFNFANLAALAKTLGTVPHFNLNFSFGQCSLLTPALNNSGVLGSNFPQSISQYSGNTLGTTQYLPPLGGSAATGDETPTTMEANTSPPVYGSNFNPNSSMDGAVPDPHTIISNYQMPAATFASNIVSIVPVLRGDTAEPTDPDYANPDLTVRSAGLRKDLIHYVTLGGIVANNYDPLLTSAWLLYLNTTRTGRGGNWLPNFQALYTQYIQPSVTSLLTNNVPYNNVLGGPGVEYMSIWDGTTAYQVNDVVTYGDVLYIALQANSNAEPDQNITGSNPIWQTPLPQGTVYQNVPTDIPLLDTFNSLTQGPLFTLFWQLSYIEASLLGYTRNKTWDAYQNANYLSGVTGADLDYTATAIQPMINSLTLGTGTAQFPITITFPSTIATVMNQVVAQASLNILNDVGYESKRLGNRYTYDQFAQATTVDRFSQFWRDFATNLSTFLAQDPYLVQFAATYFGTLDGAIDPLGNTAAYSVLQADAASRNRSWTPGTPLLNIPVAPVVSYANASIPTSTTNGWMIPLALDPAAFLSRPDVQAQPIPVQMAMLRTNLTYAAINQYQDAAAAEIATQIQTAQNVMAAAQQFGFQVESALDTTIVPPDASIVVAFDQTVYDFTNNVTNPTTFTLQTTGQYAVFGTLNWSAATSPPITGPSGMYTVTVMQNGTPIIIESTSLDPAAATQLAFSSTVNVAQGDVFQVFASHTYGTSQEVLPGSFFSMVDIGPTAPITPLPSSATSNTTAFIAGEVNDLPISFPALTVLQVQSDGTVVPIDPTTVFIDNGSPPLYSPPTGTVIAPNPDGVSMESANSGEAVDVGMTYGGVFQVTGAGFIPGELIYAGVGGVMTQDYPTLITQVQWIICVGRAMDTQTFIYEPHVPTRYISTF